MESKEKAIELVDRYSELGIGHPTSLLLSKQCALIAVDEILNEENDFIQTKWHYNYWEEVRNEINRL